MAYGCSARSKDQPLCRANRDKCFRPLPPAFSAEMAGGESASRERSGRNPVVARRANNATCYAYFLAERGLERRQKLRAVVFRRGNGMSAVCIYRILSHGGCNGDCQTVDAFADARAKADPAKIYPSFSGRVTSWLVAVFVLANVRRKRRRAIKFA